MKSAKVATLLVLTFLPTIFFAQKKPKKPAVPEVLAQARYVYVEAMDGNEFDRNLYPADRIAIADVRDGIKAWGRYTITAERDKADLIFVVRKGRLASARAGVEAEDPGSGFPSASQRGIGQQGTPNRQQQRDPGVGLTVGGEAGPEDDLLQVCAFNVNTGKRGSPLWYHSQANGLDGPRVRLFLQFKEDIEKSYPKPLTTNSQGNGSTNGQAGNGQAGNGQPGTQGKP